MMTKAVKQLSWWRGTFGRNAITGNSLSKVGHRTPICQVNKASDDLPPRS